MRLEAVARAPGFKQWYTGAFSGGSSTIKDAREGSAEGSQARAAQCSLTVEFAYEFPELG